MRIITGLAIASIILGVLVIQNSWLFILMICLVCFYGQYEWIKNEFNKTFFGFLLILNFGFWSIYFLFFGGHLLFGSGLGISYDSTPYIIYGAIIFNTAIFDTFAYIIGSKFGETYIAKNISPKKTFEGLIGGLLASISFGMSIVYLSSEIGNPDVRFHYLIVLYFFLGGIFAFLGDLLISYFKRKSGVKDTGSILPGHGGVLDRIDSHLIATPLLIILALFT
tara:strand:+ start:85 stop:753 length:669 start_codon:yes stop_codon:yes gene_type:complete